MDSLKPALSELLQGVKLGQRSAQKALYEQYYSFAKTICLQYSSSEAEAVEILNDGFLKILTQIDLYNSDYSFKSWLRKIMIHKAIDYYRQHKAKTQLLSLDSGKIQEPSYYDFPNLDNIEDLIPVLQKLSPAYRLVLNLYVLEEYSHEEIAEKLQITASTSRSNLFRALQKLKEMLEPTVKSKLKVLQK
ncbi:MAG: sigma-70 family RNA polymerase sigma factor [Saprospiraceae bacterium]